ncbi:MAG: phosphoglucosamine mutase [Candidatus Thermoplasmatota archaeon]|jgi:phosphomannomutase/phosphoglucomutase|nr:phosphoglucosamine mutase [Candidatus Thermoplasmatota archaeon]
MTKLFGTNGIRGVTNEDMNCELALGVGMAWGTFLKKNVKKPNVAIGTDARLSNHMLKSAITAGLLSTSCDVVDIGLVPTPTLQYTVRERKFDSGVIITASHNPPQFNGIKGVSSDGTEFSKDQEEEIEKIYFSKTYSLADWKNVGKLTTWDGAIDLYIKGILGCVDVDLIRKKHFHVVLDCGNGAGSLVTPILLKKLGCKITELYCEPDGMFPGRNSEPLKENLGVLMKTVTQVGADLGVAQDGDADRAIFIDENGDYIYGDKSLALAGGFITKQKKGGINVTPVTTSSCFEEVVVKNGGRVIYTKVGSPIVARVMIEENAVFGGEENGGLIFPEMQYCRDSAMSIAKILEIIAKEKKTLSELIAELPRYEVYKTKMTCPNDKKEKVMMMLAEKTKKDNNVIKVDETDGVKLYMKNGWVLMRPSGTEPIFRVYSESKEKDVAEELALTYKKLTEDIIKNL